MSALDRIDTSMTFEFGFRPSGQLVRTDCNPEVSLGGVFGVSLESFDCQVGLDPFEERFNLPPVR